MASTGGMFARDILLGAPEGMPASLLPESYHLGIS